MGLSGAQFSRLYSAGINDPEEPEKYNIYKDYVFVYLFPILISFIYIIILSKVKKI
jgi:hypothetical protein